MTTRTPPGSIGWTWTLNQQVVPDGDVTWNLFVEGDAAVPVLQPGAGFEVWIYDRADPNGLPIARVPTVAKVRFEDVLNDTGSGLVEIDTDDLDPGLFNEDHIWRISWDGEERFGFIAEQISDVSVASDGIRRRTVAGRGCGQWLANAVIYPGGWPGAAVTQRIWTIWSRAQVFLSLLQEAQARGTIPWFTVNGWDGFRDSGGIAWDDVDSLALGAGKDLLQTVTDFGSAVFDWRVTSRFGIELWAHARNRSAQVVINPGAGILSQTTTSDRRQIATSVLIQDGNYAYSEVNDSVAMGAWGRREQFGTASSAIDDPSRVAAGQTLLNLWKDQRIQRLVTVDTSLPGRKPFVDFTVGDLIGVEFPDVGVIQCRVVAIAMAAGTGTAQCELTLDFMLEHRDRTGGIYVPGTGGEPPVSPIPPNDGIGSDGGITGDPGGGTGDTPPVTDGAIPDIPFTLIGAVGAGDSPTTSVTEPFAVVGFFAALGTVATTPLVAVLQLNGAPSTSVTIPAGSVQAGVNFGPIPLAADDTYVVSISGGAGGANLGGAIKVIGTTTAPKIGFTDPTLLTNVTSPPVPVGRAFKATAINVTLGTAGTGTTTVELLKNGASVATVPIPTGALTAVRSFAAIDFPVGSLYAIKVTAGGAAADLEGTITVAL